MAWEESQYIIDQVLGGIQASQSTGIPPDNIPYVTLNTSPGEITFTGGFPDDTIIDGQVLCTCRGVRVVRKQGSVPPTGPNDGVLVGDFIKGSSKTFKGTDKGLAVGAEYQYHFYPYSDHGVFNLNNANVRSVVLNTNKIWFFAMLYNDLNPDTRVIYRDTGYTNSGFTPMMTNESNGTATAGSWGSFLTDVLKNKPYMVRRDGTADYALDPNDYTKKLDGTPSDYNNLNYDGGAFAWINKVWTQYIDVKSGGEWYRFLLSNSKPGLGYEPYGFIDPDGNELEGVWIPMGYMDNAGRSLIAGTTPTANKTMEQQKALVDAFSPRAVFFAGPILNLLRDIEYMMFRSTNIQKAAGCGYCAGQSGATTPALAANANVKNGAVPGWYGNSSKTARNKYFHSQVLGSYNGVLRDPYAWIEHGTLYYDEQYRYLNEDKNQRHAILIDQSDIRTNGWYYPDNINTIAKIPIDNFDSDGSTNSGLCDGIYLMANQPVGTKYIARRLGHPTMDVKCGPLSIMFSESGAASWANSAAIMLLPPPGYSPEQ